MSALFTALPYPPPSSFLFLPCIPLCMPTLGCSSVLAWLSQQNPWTLQPRVSRGRGTRCPFVPAAGEARACRDPWWRRGAGGPWGPALHPAEMEGACILPHCRLGARSWLLPTASPEHRSPCFSAARRRGTKDYFVLWAG